MALHYLFQYQNGGRCWIVGNCVLLCDVGEYEGYNIISFNNENNLLCHQKNLLNDVKYITYMQSVLAKKWKCTQNEKNKRPVNIIWYPLK